MGTSIHKVHLTISGRVQGVGFRQFVFMMAHELRLTGWVKNKPEGAVEVFGEGSKESVDLLIGACQKGPTMARVSVVDKTISHGNREYNDFSIVYT